jgi:hypothetical protein
MKAHTPNSTYKKLAVQWLNEHLCFVSSLVVADSLVLRNRQLLVAAKRYASLLDRQISSIDKTNLSSFRQKVDDFLFSLGNNFIKMLTTFFSFADFFQSALTFYFSFAHKIFSFDILKKIFADGKNVDDIFYFVC